MKNDYAYTLHDRAVFLEIAQEWATHREQLERKWVAIFNQISITFAGDGATYSYCHEDKDLDEVCQLLRKMGALVSEGTLR